MDGSLVGISVSTVTTGTKVGLTVGPLVVTGAIVGVAVTGACDGIAVVSCSEGSTACLRVGSTVAVAAVVGGGEGSTAGLTVGSIAAGLLVGAASVTGAGVMGGGGGTPRWLHAAGIAEQVTYTGPGHSRSATESLAQVKESRRGTLSGQVGGGLSTNEAS